MSSSKLRTGLRPEIQALRAVAAAMVVLFHIWPALVPGGYAGVDVFFVISGYLITAHLLSEARRTGRVRLGAFYARRARRLLPEAFTVIAASAVLMVALTPNVRWLQNFREMRAAALYFENWRLAADAVDYLSAATKPSLVQHYWTLSVEEQFYLVWPVMLFLVWALMRRHRPAFAVMTVIALATVGSFSYSLWMTWTHPAAAYFVTPVRVWEFGIGAALACIGDRLPSSRIAGRAWILLTWLGLVLIGATAFAINSTTPFPGLAALLPTIGTACVIAAGEPAAPSVAVLRLPPVQGFGAISYAVYLWHWPLLILGPNVVGHPLNGKDRWAALVGTLILAWLTTRLLEKPFLTSPAILRQRPTLILGVTVAVTAVLATGLAVGERESRRQIIDDAAMLKQMLLNPPACFGAAAMDPRAPCQNPALAHTLVPALPLAVTDVPTYSSCWDGPGVATLETCSFGDLANHSIPHVAIIGDSHTELYLPGLIALAQRGLITLQGQFKNECAWSAPPPQREHQSADVASCRAFNQARQAWLLRTLPTLDLVITSDRADYLRGTMRQQAEDLVRAWSPVLRADVPILTLTDTPRRPDVAVDCLGLVQPRNIGWSTCGMPESEVVRPQPWQLAANLAPHIRVIDVTPFFCRQGWCPAVVGGVVVYRDYTHMTFTYAITLGSVLDRLLLDDRMLTVRHK